MAGGEGKGKGKEVKEKGRRSEERRVGRTGGGKGKHGNGGAPSETEVMED